MAIHALALLGFDAFLTGQWDSLAEMADEGVSLCDTHSYGLLRWPHRSLQALLAAARGESASVRAISDEVIGWAVPRRAGAMTNYVLHARAVDAIGRGAFEDAYRSACAISPGARSRPTFRMRCGWCSTSSRQRCALAAGTRPPPMSQRHGKPVSPKSRRGWR